MTIHSKISLLPPIEDLQSSSVMKSLASAHRYLGELKGMATTIPNERILINTLTLQEAKESSEIENIITTQDELYKTSLFPDYFGNPAVKEVSRYAKALITNFKHVKKDKLLNINRILDIHKTLVQNNAGFRKLPGTVLKSESTGEVIYTPPQEHDEILHLMHNLEEFMNNDSMCKFDSLIKMALIHHQFESIHPFYDGNGRTGRIINILYLVAKGLLDFPVLYLSDYIIKNKTDYYQQIRHTQDTGEWEPWILFMLDGVKSTSRQTIDIIRRMKSIMMQYKHEIRRELPKIYSQDLLNNLFNHPYTKIELLQHDLQVSRVTARKYLEQLAENKFVEKHKMGRNNYYVNVPLMEIFMD